jgi:hypothetical protein
MKISCRFPEGRACGVVLDTLYSGDGKEGMRQAKLLGLKRCLWRHISSSSAMAG